MLPMSQEVVRQAGSIRRASELSALLECVLGLGNLGGSQELA